MTKTLVSIKLDSKIKKEAQSIAEELGLTLSAVMNAILREFVRTREIHVGVGLQPTPYLERIIREAERDLREGKNISPVFDNAKDAISYLRKEVRKIKDHETGIPSQIHKRTLKTVA